jgi:hypothetical protein
MNVTPPEAKTEYSKGPGGSGGGFLGLGIMCGALLGAVMLAVAEFTSLYTVHASGSAHAVASQATGSHNAYALLPVAVAVALLAVGVWRAGSRAALLGIGLLGVLAVLIALLGDLPDAHAGGLVHGPGGRYLDAVTRPSAGFYLESAGAVLLLAVSVGGFILAGPPSRRTGAGAPARRPRRDPSPER